ILSAGVIVEDLGNGVMIARDLGNGIRFAIPEPELPHELAKQFTPELAASSVMPMRSGYIETPYQSPAKDHRRERAEEMLREAYGVQPGSVRLMVQKAEPVGQISEDIRALLDDIIETEQAQLEKARQFIRYVEQMSPELRNLAAGEFSTFKLWWE